MGGRSGILLPYGQASSVLHPTSGIPPTCLQILFTCTPSLIGGQNMLGAVESCSTTAWPCWSWPVTTLLTALSACTRGDPLSPTVNLQGGSPVTWHSTLSPATRAPTPAGVPVIIRSPGCSRK